MNTALFANIEYVKPGTAAARAFNDTILQIRQCAGDSCPGLPNELEPYAFRRALDMLELVKQRGTSQLQRARTPQAAEQCAAEERYNRASVKYKRTLGFLRDHFGMVSDAVLAHCGLQRSDLQPMRNHAGSVTPQIAANLEFQIQTLEDGIAKLRELTPDRLAFIDMDARMKALEARVAKLERELNG